MTRHSDRLTPVLTVMDPRDLCDQIAAMGQQIAALREVIERRTLAPIPEWVTVKDYAKLIGVTPRTVTRNLRALETKEVCGVTLIRTK